MRDRTIDKVYIDGPCELLIMRSMDKLLTESEKSLAESYCTHLCWEISEPNHTVYVLLLLVLFIKVSHVSELVRNTQVKHRQMFESHMVHLCILHLWTKPIPLVDLHYRSICFGGASPSVGQPL